MNKQNILLLNPPGNKIYIRDYFCSKTSRSGYLLPPLDLLMLSGRLSKDYNILVMDAIAEGLSFNLAIEQINKMELIAIVSLVGAVSWKSDLEFLQRVKESTSASIICIGDVTLDKPKDLLIDHDCLDAILLDFSSEDLLQYLQGNLNSVKNMVIRVGAVVIEKERSQNQGISFELPIPKHELFLNKNYRFPFAKQKKFTVVLTDFGCPFNCSFCVMSTLGYRYREVDNIIAELEYIYKLGIREIFFMDQSFGAIKKRNLHLCTEMQRRRFNFGWTCFSRADLLDRESLISMKSAGCHTIIIGVESADSEILKIYKKGYGPEVVISVFKLCREVKIRTVGTFIIGFPEDTKKSCLETIRFAKRLNCDFASFHVAVPRGGTILRQKAIQEHLIEDNLLLMDQSGSAVTMPTYILSKEEIVGLRRKAVREFYLRPKYLLSRITACGSLREVVEQIYEGCFLIRDNLNIK